MKNLLLKSLICIFLTSTLPAYASINELIIGQVSYGGNGCPKGTAEVILNSDNSELLLRFNNYEVVAGGESSGLQRKSCNLAIPIHLPTGKNISLLKMNYSGEVSLPKKAEVLFNTETFFVGDQGQKFTESFSGKKIGPVIFENVLNLETKTKCGEDVILRVNTSLIIKNSKKNLEAKAKINSDLMESGINYKIDTRDCFK